jgi:hypothetical protein
MNLASFFSTEFERAILGRYYPGRPIEIRDNNSQNSRYTAIHERAHERLTQATSLGVVAWLCGTIWNYGTNEPEARACKRYVDRYINKCATFHEGFASTIEFLKSMEELQFALPHSFIQFPFLTIPSESYQLARETLMKLSADIADSMDLSGTAIEPQRMPLLLNAIPIAIMSPALSDDFIDGALGRKPHSLSELSGVTVRSRAIARADKGIIARAISRAIRDFPGDATLYRVSSDAARAICAAVGLTYQEPPTLDAQLAEYTPRLRSSSEFIRLDSLTEIQRRHIILSYFPQVAAGISVGFSER